MYQKTKALQDSREGPKQPSEERSSFHVSPSDTFVAGTCPTSTEASKHDAVDDGGGDGQGEEHCHQAKSYHSP